MCEFFDEETRKDMITTYYFTGPRASGKTTIGGLLAKELNLPFYDTDIYMLEKDGLTVAQVVEKEGWEGFRDRESAALHEVSAPDRVIATGGGMILRPENREHMRSIGMVLYLKTTPDVLAGRLLANPDPSLRPSLTGKSIVEEMADVLAQRSAIYEGAAHHIIDATPCIDDVLAQVLAVCRKKTVE